MVGVEVRLLQQLLKAFDGGERRLELVRDVGDQVATRALEPPRVGDVAERQDRAAAASLRDPRGRQLELRPLGDADLAGQRARRGRVQDVAGRLGDLRRQVVAAHRRVDGHPQETARGAVGDDHVARRRDGHHALHQRADHRRGAVTLMGDVRDEVLQPPGHHVERVGQHLHLLRPAARRARREVAAGELARRPRQARGALADQPRQCPSGHRRQRQHDHDRQEDPALDHRELGRQTPDGRRHADRTHRFRAELALGPKRRVGRDRLAVAGEALAGRDRDAGELIQQRRGGGHGDLALGGELRRLIADQDLAAEVGPHRAGVVAHLVVGERRHEAAVLPDRHHLPAQVLGLARRLVALDARLQRREHDEQDRQAREEPDAHQGADEQPLETRAARPHGRPSSPPNAYPTPRTVLIKTGFEASSSIFWRRWRTCTSTLRRSP